MNDAGATKPSKRVDAMEFGVLQSHAVGLTCYIDYIASVVAAATRRASATRTGIATYTTNKARDEGLSIGCRLSSGIFNRHHSNSRLICRCRSRPSHQLTLAVLSHWLDYGLLNRNDL